ncbi:hypothetical protein BC829DRAFT_189882 [Chytridium lagenaria]|nr:hypothetical protein BC829DRAFT_189882 [Chytridium lagenaria]
MQTYQVCSPFPILKSSSPLTKCIRDLAVSINASGASFPSDVYQDFVDQFKRENGTQEKHLRYFYFYCLFYSKVITYLRQFSSAQEISAFTYVGINSDLGQSGSYSGQTQWGGSDVAINKTRYPGPPTLLALPSIAG